MESKKGAALPPLAEAQRYPRRKNHESATGICEMLCFPSKQKLRDSWEKVKEWLGEMIEKLLQALALAVLLALVAYLAYLIAEAIVAALLILLAA